ncbi:Phyllocladan-16-alpha-ol synthase [Penicillium subrubescens]|uniref:Phyllocladan-16-alpha-ol synthase n=1 Tax=Penicillium subrubescens TaxID=1316194 RepID=A0A1Q5UPE4_9EURO|nr:Phyllocladan-16-alpha-ol synthase [Penicillium subrubescens]KAJ5880891.1 Phyllocladan-16-alpha-ol synthase [Penicillium subrubescens]OKP14339.1 Phyllocladan-16-alpha-ol synthase [Penicillium subrubescens]
MDSKLLHRSAEVLLDQLTEHLEDPHGLGFMSPAIYDTAWVSMIQKDVGEQKTWLFPECFGYLLQNQLEDGSWITYASQIDGILNTAASLLAMKRHFTTPLHISTISQDALSMRIDRATNALQQLLHDWDVESTLHVGFEILVPALLGYLAEESITFEFPGRDLLFSIRDQKLARFKAEFLYAPVQTTALHSLEAFIGLINFDLVLHHKVNGSYMASPSSTAAVMMHATVWDDECEEYIRHVIQHASGKNSGGVPSAFPSTIFEITWTLSTLLKAGFDLDAKSLPSVEKARAYLYDALIADKGTVGFTPRVCADADDTAKSLLILNLLQSHISPDAMLAAFEAENHFKTYPFERDPSFSANCNVLLALLHAEDPSQYSSQIEKASRFLHKHFRESPGLKVQDKWNLSPLYSWMLMTQAIARLYHLYQSSQLPSLRDFLEEELSVLLKDMAISILHQQNPNGSWGTRSSKEETAYAVLMLTYAAQCERPDVSHQEIKAAAQKGCIFLRSDTTVGSERLWVEKVTYESEILSQAYILSALNNAAGLQTEVETDPQPVSTNGVNGHHTENGEKTNGTNGIHTNGHSQGVAATNEIEIVEPESLAPIPEVMPIPEVVILDHQKNGNGHEKTLESTPTRTNHGSNLRKRREWTKEQEQIVLGPFDYLESLPGKNMRSKFIQAFNTWLQVPQEHLEVVERVITMLHNASLLVDDIEDSSVLRRGQPVAHSIFGVAQTFNSGNYVYFLALREIQKLNNPRAIDIYVNALIQLHRGQGMDVFWRDSLICPTEEEYLDMVANKTGALFCLAIDLLQLGSRVQVDLNPLVQQFGMIFQICDDYLNLKSTSYLEKKGLCEDLTEGKFSFPIIHSIRSNPGNRQLINVLKQKSQDEDLKRFAVSYMETTKTFEYIRRFVKSLTLEALDMIGDLEKQGLGENIHVRKILARMSLDDQ